MTNTIALWACLLVGAGTACAYAVEPPASLKSLADEADLVFKGTVVSSRPVQDDSFSKFRDFEVRETHFKVSSIIKGDHSGDTLLFRHYDVAPQGRVFALHPQHYHFEPGRCYVVFAKRTESDGAFRQIWACHTRKQDRGVLLCLNANEVIGKTVKEAVWNELVAMLASQNASDVVYAVSQLDEMSGEGCLLSPLSDFDREDVLPVVRELMANPDRKIAHAAIELIGSHNPYMSDTRTFQWLAVMGSGWHVGIRKMDPKADNAGGKLYWKELVSLADGEASIDTRTLAIRALGQVCEPSLAEPIERWLHDPIASVRASAVLLLADFPGQETRNRLTDLADDRASTVRASVAFAIAFARQPEMADLLGRMLADQQTMVRQAAVLSLLTLSSKNETVRAILQEHLDNKEFYPLFLLALARDNPGEYLDGLARAVEKCTKRGNQWGGKIPALAAWEMLFKHLQAQPAAEIRSGQFDRYLDAMEKLDSESSSEPRDIYAFYVQRGMSDRAQKFRQAAKKAVPYDLDRLFNEVDQNPSLYKRK